LRSGGRDNAAQRCDEHGPPKSPHGRPDLILSTITSGS
jgi:hypothetical protein